MTPEQVNKELHERAIADRLLEELREADVSYLRHGADGVEPDQLYSIQGRRVGIEVCTAFYEQRHAEGEWKFANGKIPKDPSGLTSVYKSFVKGEPLRPERSLDVMLQRSIQCELDDKCGKHYSGVDEVWLCINAHAPLADVWEIETLTKQLRMPSNCSFDRAYLGFYANDRDGGGFRVFDLLHTKP